MVVMLLIVVYCIENSNAACCLCTSDSIYFNGQYKLFILMFISKSVNQLSMLDLYCKTAL